MNLKNKIKTWGRKFFGLEETDCLGWRTLFDASAEKEHRHNSFLEANIRAISTAFCNGEIKLYNAAGEEIPYDTKGKNPLLDLLYQPAPFLTENLFKQIITAQFLVYGDVYILKTGRNTKNQPTMLIPVPAPAVQILKDDATGWPTGYRIQTANSSYRVGLEDMLHIYEGNAHSLFDGRARAQLCQLDADTIQAAKVFNLAFFENGASVGGLITFPEGVNIPQDKQQELLAVFNDQFQGAAKAHRVGILGRGGKYESYKTSHKDMEYAEGQKFSMQQIYSAMGVPPALVGLFEYAPQFNTKEQQKIFYETTVIPFAKLVSDALNENLVGDFYQDESVYLTYDFSKVKALERDWGALATAATALTAIWPVNEVKRALDLPFSDIAGGDEPPDPILNAFGGFSARAQSTKGVKGRYIRATAAQLKRHKAEKLRLIKEQSEVMRSSIEGHFKGQAERVAAWIKANESAAFDYDAALGGLDAQRNALLVVKVPALSQIYRAGIDFEQDYLQSLAPEKNFHFISRKDTAGRVAAWAREYAYKWADSIERTTLERISKIVEAGLANEMTSKQINNILLQFFSEEGYEPGEITQNANGAKVSVFDRVHTIVQTETRATISEAQLEAYRTTPFVNAKEWITSMGDVDHHEGHLEMDGQRVQVDSEFTNPVTGQHTQAPSQFGTADQDINCLCDITPLVLDED